MANGLTITAPITFGGTGKSAYQSYLDTTTDDPVLTEAEWSASGGGGGGGDALTSDGLDQFAATTSAELAGVISDETGTGALVFANSPTLVTPALGTPASGDLANCTFPTLNQDTTGNAATATALETARTIAGVSFDGTANIAIAFGDLSDSGTVDLPVVNTPLSIALSLKQDAADLATVAVTGDFGDLTGTVTSGTWQGTAIADAYIASAATWNAKADATVVEDYVDGGTLSAGAISHDVSTGKSLSLTALDSDTNLTLTNIEERETVEVFIRQTVSGGNTFSFDHATYSIVGVTTAIAGLAVGEWGIAYATRVGATLLVSAIALPTS